MRPGITRSAPSHLSLIGRTAVCLSSVPPRGRGSWAYPLRVMEEPTGGHTLASNGRRWDAAGAGRILGVFLVMPSEWVCGDQRARAAMSHRVTSRGVPSREMEGRAARPLSLTRNPPCDQDAQVSPRVSKQRTAQRLGGARPNWAIACRRAYDRLRAARRTFRRLLGPETRVASLISSC